MLLELDRVSCGYQTKVISSNISLQVESGEILSLLGPNGVGKTTLFKTVLGFLKILDGEIRLDGESITHWSRGKLARAVAYVPQAHTPPFPFTVLDVVLMGRTAHLSVVSSPSKKDRHIADSVLDALHIRYLRNQIYTEISGGERQMVLIARALAQQPKILIMDEPTSNLDFGNQVKVLEQIQTLAKSGLGIFMTTHFPDHTFLCSTKVALMQRGAPFQVGDVDEIVTEQNLQSAYGVDVRIIKKNISKAVCLRSCVPVLNMEELPAETNLMAGKDEPNESRQASIG